ncbi:oxidoreductase [Sporolactobacillus sp. THM7-7]|nr:oxidoreductase [Sporolactobacillus sp. THM7-7]
MMLVLVVTLFFYQRPSGGVQPPFGQLMSHQESPKTEQPAQPESLQPVNTDPISYTLQNNALHITYNSGEDWVSVPISKNQLFGGEYQGDKSELIDGSYMLTKNQAAFLSTDGIDQQTVSLTYSTDQGKTWRKAAVTHAFPGVRFRKVQFLNSDFGYIILSGGRTMSSEYSAVYLTHDGGKNWNETTNSGVTRLIYDGGFVDESTGFLSFGTINPEAPDLYVTTNRGKTWDKAEVHVPEKYHPMFVTAEVPTVEGDYLAVLVNQGPNGDYLGGQVKGKFISKDGGKTWSFSAEVRSNEAE